MRTLKLILPIILLILLFVSSSIFDTREVDSCQTDEESLNKLDFGKNLFFETRLFEDTRRSCATCHDPKLTFTDGYRKGIAIKADPLTKNTPTLFNVSKYHFFNWANPELTNLEDQILLPLFSSHPAEMGKKIKDFNWLIRDKKYKHIIEKAFPNCKTIGVSEITEVLALYCTSLAATRSPYDIFLESGDSTVMTKDALAGMSLFFSKEFSCANCHSGEHFSVATMDSASIDNSFFYTGVDQSVTTKIRVPSLRNLAFTKPYFHNGSATNLKGVIEHYAYGGRLSDPPRQMAKSFDVNQDVIRQLSAFLLSLSDSTVLMIDNIKDPNNGTVENYINDY